MLTTLVTGCAVRSTPWRPLLRAFVASLKVRKRALIIDLKLPVNPPAKDIHRPAVGIVAAVGNELIVEGEVRRGG